MFGCAAWRSNSDQAATVHAHRVIVKNRSILGVYITMAWSRSREQPSAVYAIMIRKQVRTCQCYNMRSRSRMHVHVCIELTLRR